MKKTLVIVESPGKISKISSFLGSDYIVKASYGHVQDLDKSTLSIDVENNFMPLYITNPDKTKVVKELKGLVKDCSDVILAADGDREGEAIAHSLSNVLKLTNPKRIIFHEITKTAILKALENPTIINMNMVNAQQTRRLLDRLVGYKISPILWRHLSSDAKSAGRVQSVVVKIIIDKENEINKSISEPYFKTIAIFDYEEEKINSILQKRIKEEEIKPFLESINKKTIFKVSNIENKKSIRKPSYPFITSSLQQEASTKLRFNVKKTMDVAQKLYELGLITYMRTDCPNMSDTAIADATKYIIDTFGKDYSEPRKYQSKNSNSQDAHECIRPTHLEEKEPENLNGDNKKLYDLIWKRSIASQMSNATINIQLITINDIFIATLENIDFAGYMIVYDNSLEDEEKVLGKLEIKKNDILKLNKILITEEYTKLPSRYNEASLVKYLETHGIGRPSTFASIISKVIERNYVEIKNIDGIKKMSKSFELNKFKIKESSKEIIIGKEQSKIVSTKNGEQVNDFLIKHFDQIMNVEFTSTFETYLDKIADGKANWITILKNFYDMFNPIVEQLIHLKPLNKTQDDLIGEDIYKGTGKWGPYVKIKIDGEWKYANLGDISIDDITIEQAKELLLWPKHIGKIGNSIISLNKGQYGFYLKYNGNNYSVSNDNIDLDQAKIIINATKSFNIKDKIVNIKNGEYGNYLQIVSKNKKQNIPIPKKINIDKITLENVLEIIANKNNK